MKIPRRIAARTELLRATVNGMPSDLSDAERAELLALADDIEAVFTAVTDFSMDSTYNEQTRREINAQLFEGCQRRAAHAFVNMALAKNFVEYRELSREIPNQRAFRHVLYIFDPAAYDALRKDKYGVTDETHDQFDAERERYRKERGG